MAAVNPEILVDELFAGTDRYGTTYAALVVQGDDVLAERYGGELPHFDAPGTPVEPDTPLLSWSIAKSVLHAAVGVAVAESRLLMHERAPVAQWSKPGDPRRDITLEHLLAMRDGLDFVEDYDDAGRSDVIEMLFGAGKDDVAHFAAHRLLRHPPGTVFNYSSGTSNIMARVLGDAVGDIEQWLRTRVFDPIGMPTATLTLDAAGTWVGSSYVHATARDWVRFGQCYLHEGAVGRHLVLRKEWVASGIRPRSIDPDTGRGYGAHWWLLGDRHGSFYASGYEGQRVLVCPPIDLVVVRFGKSSADQYPALLDWARSVIELCAATLRP